MRINGIDLEPFTPMQRRILVAIAGCAPGSINANKIIEKVYPDPDLEPDWAESAIRVQILNIRKILDDRFRIVARLGRGGGYAFEPVNADA